MIKGRYFVVEVGPDAHPFLLLIAPCAAALGSSSASITTVSDL